MHSSTCSTDAFEHAPPRTRRGPARRCGIGASVVVAVLALTLSACAELPLRQAEPMDTPTLTDVSDTRLGRTVADAVARHPGLTGAHLLEMGQDAFAARAVLAAAADRTLDVQYYIWHGDTTGMMLIDALRDAARRGVRVRLLLDDNGTHGLDDTWRALDAEPGVEVRLYNPFAHRRLRVIDYVGDFSRVNRRMHNKSFTADGLATIVGGRNVGDEYFDAGEGTAFADLDVVVVGPVVADVTDAFERYWRSASAYPLERLLPAADDAARAALDTRLAQAREAPETVAYQEAVRRSPVMQVLSGGGLTLDWSKALLVCDDPVKTLGPDHDRELRLFPQLLEAIGRPERSVDIVSPYFVPGDDGTKSLVDLARRGVHVRILTNAYESTDVAAVHAGYAKRRRALLEAGVSLHELRKRGTRLTGPRSFGGSSSSSLHAKTFAVDGAMLFVGSFNLDLRSALLNTEMGLVLYSPKLANDLIRVFQTRVPTSAYEVQLDPKGELVWIKRTEAGEERLTSEPGAGPVDRAWVDFLSWLPIEWML
jgi:putative cardiolipin synthase